MRACGSIYGSLSHAMRQATAQIRAEQTERKRARERERVMASEDWGDGDSMSVLIKHGSETLQVSLPASASVRDLMEQLQQLTNVLPRGQKLIHKGKVLDCNATLKSVNIGSGSKIMLMASQGIHQGPSPVSKSTMPNKKEKNDNSPSLIIEKNQNPLQNIRIGSWKTTGIVSLRDSDLQIIPSEVWALGSSARVLDLSGNRVKEFPRSICSLTHLKRLCLSNNGLVDGVTHWKSLSFLKSLTLLALDHNLLTFIPAEIGELSSLRQLLVSHNKLTTVHENIGSLQLLEKLELNENCLNSMPSSLGKCSSLIEIKLSRNFLKVLPSTIGNLKCLQVLHLENNALESFPADVLQGCKELNSLSLDGNGVTIESLRELQGWKEFDERRRSKYSKQLDFHVIGASGGFDEGADSQEWHHW